VQDALDARIETYAAWKGLPFDEAVDQLLDSALRFSESRRQVSIAAQARRTPEQRRAAAVHAARARWSRPRG
jgi:hypothetical protein